MAKEKKLTAADLIREGYRFKTPQEVLRDRIIELIEGYRREGLSEEEAMGRLFPNTILDPDVLKELVSALISGSHVLFFGPSGTGKTTLAKDIWNLFPKEIYAVEGCPVQDDPLSIVDEEVARKYPPCPMCQRRFAKDGIFDPREVDPTSVPVTRTKLKEGYGFARVQGSSEVFPDHLTGVINIHKLEALGDPTSPLILEPGKLLQSNRGVLMVDEVGKLPLGTQNVLLQALQEGIVTPAKSRETFPARFVAVTTSNLRDLDNITEPLNDRLSNVYVDWSKEHRNNLKIAYLSHPLWEGDGVAFPRVYVEAAVYLLENWRAMGVDVPELSEVGSNRTMMDVISRSWAYARMAGKGRVDLGDFRKGARDALYGRIRARGGDSFLRNEEIVATFLKENLPEVIEEALRSWWCSFSQKSLGSQPALERELKESLKSVLEGSASPESLKGRVSVERFLEYLKSVEPSSRWLDETSLLKMAAETVAEISDEGVIKCRGE
ncbi:MAG: sigma 54-interacting transcriptional regulator [Thermoplasmata archaeon]|nr:sigma 54-interacting transcriptional regulator [Thermoplasmata archaeon]